MLRREAAYNFWKEGIMAGRSNCCRYEPSLEDLLEDDEMMAPVLRSAGFDAPAFRAMIAETARRIDGRAGYAAGYAEEEHE
jgi:hypothetical protein